MNSRVCVECLLFFLSSCLFSSPPLQLYPSHTNKKKYTLCWYWLSESSVLFSVLWKPLCDKCALLHSLSPARLVTWAPPGENRCLDANWNYMRIDFLSRSSRSELRGRMKIIQASFTSPFFHSHLSITPSASTGSFIRLILLHLQHLLTLFASMHGDKLDERQKRTETFILVQIALTTRRDICHKCEKPPEILSTNHFLLLQRRWRNVSAFKIGLWLKKDTKNGRKGVQNVWTAERQS